ncbi:MAG: ABC transporter permease [Dehalococcoidia bacterium]|nr:ABC transporter permease [Dehalococcoidia bacterium]
MEQLSHIWFFALKDLKIFFKDRIALLFSLLFPFMFIMLFFFLNIDGAAADPRLELHLVTQEAVGGISHQIIGAMETKDESLLQPGEAVVVWDKDYNEAVRAVEEGELKGFLAFPEDFTEGVLMGFGTRLEVVTDPEATYTRAALSGMAQSIASQVGAYQVVNSTIVGLLVGQEVNSPGDMVDIGQIMQQLYSRQGGDETGETFIEFETDKVGDIEAESPSNYVVPGYLVMFVFFAAALSAEMIVRERENHTLERLLASSVKRSSIIGGIYLGTAIRGLIQIALFLGVGMLALDMDFGRSPGAVILLSVLMVLMSSAFGIMLATLVKTQRSASALGVLVSLAIAPLGGCWWPLFITPRWMQFMAKVTPHGWATTGFNKLMVFGGDFSSAVPEMVALACFGLAFAVVAVLRFRSSASS